MYSHFYYKKCLISDYLIYFSQTYIEKLIFNDLSSHNTEKVLKQIRKLHWNDSDESAFIVKTLGSVWNYKYYNIRYGASLIAGLVSYHDWVGPQIVDDTLEGMRVGMEINDPKFNQRRLAISKFVGELYNYRLIDSGVVFKVTFI
jgi:regulator of nonsense transcripts 2